MHQLQIIDTHIPGRAAVQVRVAHCAHQRGITTVTGAVDADTVAVSNALVDGPTCGVGQIVLHAAAPFLAPRLKIGGAVVARAPIVHPQHRIAGIRQQLRVEIETPLVEHPIGAAMRQ
ncbi:hypothetical protein D3C81_1568350 [compost metagenome]